MSWNVIIEGLFVLLKVMFCLSFVVCMILVFLRCRFGFICVMLIKVFVIIGYFEFILSNWLR